MLGHHYGIQWFVQPADLFLRTGQRNNKKNFIHKEKIDSYSILPDIQGIMKTNVSQITS